jgi:hypothetical protein
MPEPRPGIAGRPRIVANRDDRGGVDVDSTPGLDHARVRQCARLAIWDTKFSGFDGADMVVDYQLDID